MTTLTERESDENYAELLALYRNDSARKAVDEARRETLAACISVNESMANECEQFAKNLMATAGDRDDAARSIAKEYVGRAGVLRAAARAMRQRVVKS